MGPQAAANAAYGCFNLFDLDNAYHKRNIDDVDGVRQSRNHLREILK
jgi:hypothetical protein